jgi:murein DD-endopeptidase MepM/ murein hydrolase activator NlpD
MRIAKKTLASTLTVLAVAPLATLLALLLSAQSARSAEPPTCTGNLQLSLSAPLTSQGSLLLAEVRSATPLQEVTANWSDHKIEFWKVVEPAKPGAKSKTLASVEHWQAMIGADLEKAPGAYPLAVSAKSETSAPASDAPLTCSASIAIRAGKFAVESLKVDNKFVEPDEQQAQRAAAEQKKLKEIYDTVTPEKLWQGPFQWPLTGITQGTNFGKRRILNGQPRSPHTGADFPALTGTPIHATQNGRVVLAEELYFSGNTVIIDHGLGIYTLYAHMSEIGATAGQDVKAGEVIGKVGATGRVTGPHLHWGAMVDHARVNPAQLVSIFRPKTAAAAPKRGSTRSRQRS